MSENTKVEGLAFTAKDEASATADKIGASFERLHHAAEHAREKVGEFAHHAATGALASVGLGFGLHAIFEKAEEANMEMARVTKSVAGTQFAMQGWQPGISAVDRMTYSMKQGAEVGEELHRQAMALREPIEQMGQVYSSVAAIGFGRLGMSQKGVLDLTEKLAAASKVYGISAEEAVSTVNRALITGHIRAVTPFGIALRDALDLEHHTGGKHGGKKLTSEQMFEKMDSSLKSMVPAAQRMGKDMAGSLSEAKMLVDEMLRDLTGPMFKEQTKSLSEWVDKIRTVKEDGKSIMAIYGEKIAGAFQTIKSATGFIVDHWKSLIAIYAASKLAGFMSGFAGKGAAHGEGAAGAAAGAVGAMTVNAGVVNVNGSGVAAKLGTELSTAMRPSMSDTIGKFAGMAGKAFMVTEALGGLYIAADSLAKYIDSKQTEELGKGRGAASLLTSVHNFERAAVAMRDQGKAGEQSAVASMKSAFESMGLKPGQKATAAGVGGMLEGLPSDIAAKMVNELHYLMPETVKHARAEDIKMMPKEFGLQIATAMNEFMARFAAGESASPNLRKVPRGHGDINIQNLTITQDFKEADPDRVFHRVTNEISGLANSPGKGRLSTGMAGGL
jgi:hypothetical protein